MMTPAVSQWVASWPTPFTREMAVERIAGARAAVDKEMALPCAIERRSDGVLLGWIGVTRDAVDGRLGALGYWLGEEHHGRGYMREAVPALVDMAFRRLDLDKIEAAAQPENAASFAVLRRCGMEPVGERMIFAAARGQEERCLVYETARKMPDANRSEGGAIVRQGVIGLIGGLSWESSSEYYRIINQAVRNKLGGVRSARCLMWSFDFGEVEALQQAGRWHDAASLMIDAARRLERGGADFFLICSNTMHRMADQVQAAVSMPLLHIADPTAARIKGQGIERVGLLGTAFTMEQDFYKGRLEHRFGLDVLVPEADDRAVVHRVIYDELVQGRVERTSRAEYQAVIARLVERGAQAVILGCTEIMLLVKPEDSSVPLFDTTYIHAEAAVERALSAGREN